MTATDKEDHVTTRQLQLIEHPNLVPYQVGLDRQLERVKAIFENPEIPFELHVLEHEHVLTLGRAVEQEHLLFSKEELMSKGFDWVEVSRGGSITYHGPGQLVVYLHVHLKELGLSLTGYLRDLEQWVIDALAHFDVDAGRVQGKTGVWVSSGKICAMGIAAKRYVTYHGIGLNFDVDLDRFQWFVPCGLQEPVASLSPLLGRTVTREEVVSALELSLPPWLARLRKESKT
jgi:lipoate-protein ligase B